MEKLSVIDFAEKRMKEECEQNRLGADNEQDIRYWANYLDGARAQKKERERINETDKIYCGKCANRFKCIIPKKTETDINGGCEDFQEEGKRRRISEILEEVASEMCDNYCKWAFLCLTEDELYEHCDKCPLINKL